MTSAKKDVFAQFSYGRILTFIEAKVPEYVKEVRAIEHDIALSNWFWAKYYARLEDEREKATTRLLEIESQVNVARLAERPRDEIEKLERARRTHLKNCDMRTVSRSVVDKIAYQLRTDHTNNKIKIYNEDSMLNESAELKAFLPETDHVVDCTKTPYTVMHIVGVRGSNGELEDGLMHNLVGLDPTYGSHYTRRARLVDELRYLTSFKKRMQRSHNRRVLIGKDAGNYKIMTTYMNKEMIPDYSEDEPDETELLGSSVEDSDSDDEPEPMHVQNEPTGASQPKDDDFDASDDDDDGMMEEAGEDDEDDEDDFVSSEDDNEFLV